MFFRQNSYRLTLLTPYATIIFDMKYLHSLLTIRKKLKRKSIEDYQQELLVRQGREQFRMLLQKGLGVPVAFL